MREKPPGTAISCLEETGGAPGSPMPHAHGFSILRGRGAPASARTQQDAEAVRMRHWRSGSSAGFFEAANRSCGDFYTHFILLVQQPTSVIVVPTGAKSEHWPTRESKNSPYQQCPLHSHSHVGIPINHRLSLHCTEGTVFWTLVAHCGSPPLLAFSVL